MTKHEIQPKKLEIKNLHVSVEGKEILQGVSIVFHPGKIHVLMGPNGAGKSTLAHAIMGHPKYVITQGQIVLDGKEITHLPVDERARAGLFLSFQYPTEVAGIKLTHFLRTIVNNKREQKLSVMEFHKVLEEKMNRLHIDKAFVKRYLNEGFSGGEKKKSEILQLMLLEPNYALLDETDSGLDVDGIKIVAEGINAVRERNKALSVIVITHYIRFLDYLKPDEVSVMYRGRIIKQGTAAVACEIEEKGFGQFIDKIDTIDKINRIDEVK